MVDTSTAGHQRAPGTTSVLSYCVVIIPNAPRTIPSVLEAASVFEERQIVNERTNFFLYVNYSFFDLFLDKSIIKNIHQKNTKLYGLEPPEITIFETRDHSVQTEQKFYVCLWIAVSS